MAAREWFTPTNTADLKPADRAVLNRAVRNTFPPGREPQRIQLVVFRTVYRPGMSAADLIAAAEAGQST